MTVEEKIDQQGANPVREAIEHLSALPGDESLARGLECDGEWRNAWSRMVAYAWMSQENLEACVANPVPMLYKLSKYIPPRGLVLRFSASLEDGSIITTPEWPKVTEWQGNAAAGEAIPEKLFNDQKELEEFLASYSYDDSAMARGTNGWRELGKNLPTEITLAMPPKPADSSVRSFALADYQASGKIFPFTS